VGPSSGAVFSAMEKLSLDGGHVVGIFADDGRKFKSLYAQQNVFTEEHFDKALKEAVHLSNAIYL
jgi:cysteine synthase B